MQGATGGVVGFAEFIDGDLDVLGAGFFQRLDRGIEAVLSGAADAARDLLGGQRIGGGEYQGFDDLGQFHG